MDLNIVLSEVRVRHDARDKRPWWLVGGGNGSTQVAALIMGFLALL